MKKGRPRGGRPPKSAHTSTQSRKLDNPRRVAGHLTKHRVRVAKQSGERKPRRATKTALVDARLVDEVMQVVWSARRAVRGPCCLLSGLGRWSDATSTEPMAARRTRTTRRHERGAPPSAIKTSTEINLRQRERTARRP